MSLILFSQSKTGNHEFGFQNSQPMELQHGMSDKLKLLAKKSNSDQQKDIADLKSQGNKQQ